MISLAYSLGEGEVIGKLYLSCNQRAFLLYAKMLSGTTGIQEDVVLKTNPFRIYEMSWFPRQPIMDSKE